MFSKASPAPAMKQLSSTDAVLGAAGKGHGGVLPYPSPRCSVLLDPGILAPTELLESQKRG